MKKGQPAGGEPRRWTGLTLPQLASREQRTGARPTTDPRQKLAGGFPLGNLGKSAASGQASTPASLRVTAGAPWPLPLSKKLHFVDSVLIPLSFEKGNLWNYTRMLC